MGGLSSSLLAKDWMLMEESGCLLLGHALEHWFFVDWEGQYLYKGMGIAEMSAGRRESCLEAQGFTASAVLPLWVFCPF